MLSRAATHGPDTPLRSGWPVLGGRARIAAIAVLLAAYAVFQLGIGLANADRWSATADEPLHLAAGYAALQYGDYRFDPTHPPLLRLWSALPLLRGGERALDRAAFSRPEAASGQYHVYEEADKFLYGPGNGHQVLASARFMTLLLGLGLGLLVFCWAYEWLGLGPAALALLFCALEPNLAAHGALVTTDMGLTVFFLGAAYLLWRTQRAFTAANVAGLCIFTSLCLVSKFSAVLLLPSLALLLFLSVRRGTAINARRAWLTAGLLALCGWFTIWAVYGFRYAPGPDGSPLAAVPPGTGSSLLARICGGIDSLHLLPNAFTAGFGQSVLSSVQLPSYLNGRIGTGGWWYYFPFAFLVKTPSALLLLAAGGAILMLARVARGAARDEWYLAVPALVYLAGAMSSDINLGVRHILPLYPFVILLAASAARTLLEPGRMPGRLALGAVTVLALIGFARGYPATLSYFNLLAGGPANGSKYLADSNFDWGQHLKSLKSWMDAQGVPEINLAYAGTINPAHYGINATCLPGSPYYARLGVPKLPGYVAISATIQTGVYLGRDWRMFYRGFENLTPAAIIGDTIRVYWIERWPSPPSPDREDTAENAGDHLRLADAFAYQFNWPEFAVPQYRAFLQHQPSDSPALAKLSLALMLTGQAKEGGETFRRAQDLDPQPGRLGADFALTLSKAGLADEALVQARRAVTLAPEDALAHDALGLVLGRTGRIAEALAAFERAAQLAPGSETIQSHLRATRQLAPPAR